MEEVYNQMNNTNYMIVCIVIGGGPAGLSAAIYRGGIADQLLVIDTESDGR